MKLRSTQQALVLALGLPLGWWAPNTMATAQTHPPFKANGPQDWAADAIWYQIFPDRFRNGDPRNDPDTASLVGAYPHDIITPWQIHPWGADWYGLQGAEQARGKGIWHAIQLRRAGGDIQGVIDRLDYLADLGVNALYLNPIFWAPSAHKYDARMLHHVDPNFGPDPEGDRAQIAAETSEDPRTWTWTQADRLVLRLISEVHRRNMKIIFDGVFNHMGQESFAFRDVVERQRESRFQDWFIVRSWEDPAQGTRFTYDGWYGVRELPELREDEGGLVEGPRQYIFAATRRWMDPDNDGDPRDGIDGWRLDVAFCVAHPFWKDWSALVRSINPAAYTTAEVIDPPEQMKPYLQGDEFDAVMNYNFTFAATEFFLEDNSGNTASTFDDRLRELRTAFPDDVAFRMQNLLDSHDTNRIASHIVNRGLAPMRDWGNYFEVSKATNPRYETRAPTADERAIQKLLIALQMTYVGAPMIYYGDEAGMWGANDPDSRKPMVWDDVVYESERMQPDGAPYDHPQPVAFDADLFAHYQRLTGIRRNQAALRRGCFKTLVADGDVFGFVRTLEGSPTVYAIFNRANREVVLHQSPLPAGFVLRDEMTDELVTGAALQTMRPRSVRILRLRSGDAEGPGDPGCR